MSLTKEREAEIRAHWEKKRVEDGFAFFGYQELLTALDETRAQAAEMWEALESYLEFDDITASIAKKALAPGAGSEMLVELKHLRDVSLHQDYIKIGENLRVREADLNRLQCPSTCYPPTTGGCSLESLLALAERVVEASRYSLQGIIDDPMARLNELHEALKAYDAKAKGDVV